VALAPLVDQQDLFAVLEGQPVVHGMIGAALSEMTAGFDSAMAGQWYTNRP